MSSQSSSSSEASKITKNEIIDLILKLQALLPHINQRQDSRVSASKILKETCSYIGKLQREVDDLSEKLSQMLDSMDISNVDVESLISILLQQ
ncbi:hypothetical protein JCGZ_11607 [Jatropha curcas]|uniref:BHLH domain-containing protein n=1 Tax=Jatropha curcas TaxID=180498 RepID=A0A067K4V8_JATCU|nr:transcription factor PRE5 [Jatropha curcas]KDP31231.1 hypothetical protein JCGZ_11607 [Jatropha curcas]